MKLTTYVILILIFSGCSAIDKEESPPPQSGTVSPVLLGSCTLTDSTGERMSCTEYYGQDLAMDGIKQSCDTLYKGSAQSNFASGKPCVRSQILGVCEFPTGIPEISQNNFVYYGVVSEDGLTALEILRDSCLNMQNDRGETGKWIPG